MLRLYYAQYKKFKKTGALDQDCELRKIADIYIEKVQGAWIVSFTTDLLDTIAKRWVSL